MPHRGCSFCGDIENREVTVTYCERDRPEPDDKWVKCYTRGARAPIGIWDQRTALYKGESRA